jgi:chaperonin cofactor prefoldin
VTEYQQLLQRFEKVFDMIGEVQKDITQIKITMTENTVIVKEHERRSLSAEKWLTQLQAATNALEKEYLMLKGQLKTLIEEKKSAKESIKETEKTLNIFRSIPEILKFFALLAGTASALYGAYALIEKMVNK